MRKPQDRINYEKNDKKKGFYKRYGVEQDGTIWSALAKILTKNSSKDMIDAIQTILKRVETKPLPFIQANNSQLIIAFKRPYSEFDMHINDFME